MPTIVGTSGSETLNGTSGDDVFRLEGGTDTVNGAGGNDSVDLSDAPTAVNINLAAGTLSGWGSATLNGVSQISGGYNGGVLTGGAATTYISAPGGSTTVNVGPLSTIVALGAGTATVHGGAGNDEIYVGSGGAAIDGGGGYNGVSFINATGYVSADLYSGDWHTTAGDSFTNIQNLEGGNYGNTLKGDWHYNIITGGAASDIIEGWQGNDTLTGRGGADLFIMDQGTGNTVITDFSHAEGDRIDLSAYGFHTLADILAVSAQSGANTVITLGGGSLTLNNVAMSALTASDFANLGSETITYLSGIRTALFHGSIGQYSISASATATGGSVTVADSVAGRDGTNTLTDLQQAQFSDVTLVFDLTSSQDLMVYKIYQAAYGRMPDDAGFRYWAVAADTGTGAMAIADQFLAAPEFTQKYGANPTNSQYITELYSNVLGRAPDQAGLDYWIGQANAGMARDQLLVSFAGSPENAQLIGTHISNGLWTTA